MNEEKLVKLIAFYFPQFHAIPENDEWWGKGFTDWVNVRRATPHFRGHHQPRVPLGNRYYDQSDKQTLEWQIGIARKYGLYGFCHYHYWFDGKQLLETPTNIVLGSKDLDFPFRMGQRNLVTVGLAGTIILQEQTTDDKGHGAHLRLLFRAWACRASRSRASPPDLSRSSHPAD
jgi:hypothetical protein